MRKFTERFFSAPADSFFIFGPRGTGKSTWLKKFLIYLGYPMAKIKFDVFSVGYGNSQHNASKYAFLRPSNYCRLLCAELDRIIAFMQSLYLLAPARTAFGFFGRKLVAVAIHPIHGPF